MEIQQKMDEYGCIYSVQLVDLVGLPVSTPVPAVGLPNWKLKDRCLANLWGLANL